MPANPTLPGAAPHPAERRLDEALGLTESLTTILEGLLIELAEEAPLLILERSLHDGAWVIGLRGDRARDGEAFGRVSFELRADGPSVECTFRATAGSRDLRSDSCRVEPNANSEQELSSFAETALLTFAKVYFDIGSQTVRSANS